MYNKVILVGNLTRDIEMKYSQGGMAIAKSAIATSRKFKSNTGEQKEEVCFIDITFFGRSAEVANQYLRKGYKILVEGRLVFEQWSDQNGQKRSKHGVTVDVMQMLDSKATTNADAPTTNTQQESNPTYGSNQNTVTQQEPVYEQARTQAPKAEDIPSYDEKMMSEIDEIDDVVPF